MDGQEESESFLTAHMRLPHSQKMLLENEELSLTHLKDLLG